MPVAETLPVAMSSTDNVQRDRSRSPRRSNRSRSPRRDRSPYDSTRRSRSRSREDYRRSERRSRSPRGTGASGGGYGSSYGAGRQGGQRNYEDRSGASQDRMSSAAQNSQQDRRVYVGNLSYDVKWHHLKDFMRQGTWHTSPHSVDKMRQSRVLKISVMKRVRVLTSDSLAAGEVLYADVLLLPNGMSKVRNSLWWSPFLLSFGME